MTNLFLCDLELDALEERLEGFVANLQENLEALGIDIAVRRATSSLEYDSFYMCDECGVWAKYGLCACVDYELPY